jgi:uncharacterized protein
MFSDYLGVLSLAVVVGLSLGAMGGGGSIITTPVLVYVAHVPPERAVGMSLFIVGATSLVGALLQARERNVAFAPMILFSVTGMAGAYLGAAGTHLVRREVLMLLFAAIMLSAGAAMWNGSRHRQPSRSFSSPYKCLAAGFAVGLLTGFIGVGGGFLIVPALVLVAGLDSKLAIGTSPAIITFNSITGLLGQMRYIEMDWKFVAGFLVFAVAGMVTGVGISKNLPEARLRRIFAMVVIVLGVAVGLQNLLMLHWI